MMSESWGNSDSDRDVQPTDRRGHPDELTELQERGALRLLHGQYYCVAGDEGISSGVGDGGSDVGSPYHHARRQPIAPAAETAADRSHARVRRSPGYGLSKIVNSRSISVGVELQGIRHPGNGSR